MFHDTVKKCVEHTPNTKGRADNPHKIIVGGKAVDNYHPEVDFEFWEGDDSLGIAFPELPNGWTPVIDEVTGKVSLNTDFVDVEIYMLDDSSLEFSAILKVKPPKNKTYWGFQLTNWENYDFYFQEDATQIAGSSIVTENNIDYCLWVDPQIGDTCKRPLTLCGAYAVYHKANKNNNYMTGKVINIDRPIFIDNDGDTAWGDITIVDGLVSIIPPTGNWLTKAAYPVTIDPTFGFTGIAGTDSSYGSGVQTESYPYHTASSGDTLTTGHCYCYSNTSSTRNLYMGIYDITTTTPVNLLEGANSTFSNGTAAWNTVTLTSSLVASTVYAPSFHNDATSDFHYFYDSGTDTSYDFVASPNPDPWVETGNIGRQYSVYATYTEGGAGLGVPIAAYHHNHNIGSNL